MYSVCVWEVGRQAPSIVSHLSRPQTQPQAAGYTYTHTLTMQQVTGKDRLEMSERCRGKIEWMGRGRGRTRRCETKVIDVWIEGGNLRDLILKGKKKTDAESKEVIEGVCEEKNHD